MSIRELPSRPNLEHLKHQARTLLEAAQASQAEATARFAALGIPADPKYSDALHVIAREYGFHTWSALKLHTVITGEDSVEALTAAIQANDASLVANVLARHPPLQSSLNEPLPGLAFDAPALIDAVRKDNRHMVDVLLDAGAGINARTRWWAGGFGVLDLATPDLAAYLITRGAYVDIHAAARLGMAERVQHLLNQDASLVHARGGDGQFPLHFAADPTIASLLLDRGAEIDARDIDHESTAAQYMVSIAPHRHGVVRLLLSRGAQPDILMASALGDLALVESILDGDPETLRITVNERHFPKRDPRSGGSIYLYGFGLTKSPHMIAHEFGHPAVFNLLMRRSPPWLRLVQSAEIGNESLANEILSQHPALFARLTSRAARRLIGVAFRNNHRALNFLLEHGWPPNAALDNNQTALHFAAWHGNVEMVRALLSHGALVNPCESEHGGTPLAWALYGSLHGQSRETGDYVAVTRLLLAAGAAIPPSEGPLQATEEVLEVIRPHLSSITSR